MFALVEGIERVKDCSNTTNHAVCNAAVHCSAISLQLLLHSVAPLSYNDRLPALDPVTLQLLHGAAAAAALAAIQNVLQERVWANQSAV
jgi:hypothetical protein